MVPDLIAQQGERDLAEVDSQCPTIPAWRLREHPAGLNPFENEESRGRYDGKNGSRQGHRTVARIKVITAGVRAAMTPPVATVFPEASTPRRGGPTRGGLQRSFDAAGAAAIQQLSGLG